MNIQEQLKHLKSRAKSTKWVNNERTGKRELRNLKSLNPPNYYVASICKFRETIAKHLFTVSTVDSVLTMKRKYHMMSNTKWT